MGCNLAVGANLFAAMPDVDRIDLTLCGIVTGRINSPLHVCTENGKQVLVGSSGQIGRYFDNFRALIFGVVIEGGEFIRPYAH
jgi:hypothetical protein